MSGMFEERFFLEIFVTLEITYFCLIFYLFQFNASLLNWK